MPKYSKEALSSAVMEVNNGLSSIRAASKKYSVPVTTLHDRISGKVDAGAKWGKEPLVPFEKEVELIQYALKRSTMGIGFSKEAFLRFAAIFAKSLGVTFKNNIATEKWWRGLKLRHPEFSLRSPESTTSGRHTAMTRLRISRYFSSLKDALEENKLFDVKSKIWNMDETGMNMAPKAPKVIARKGTKTVHNKASASRELITIVACGNAEGTVIPPHVIVPGKTKRALQSYDAVNASPGTNISTSESGWIKAGISELWFTETFLKNIGPERPQILIMDGHASHHHVELIELARKEKIIIIELPSKTSHYTQPFDRTVFKSLKTSWGKLLHEFTASTGVTVGHAQFFRLFAKAWASAVTKDNVSKGFEATGICPYNPGVIPDSAYEPSELYVPSQPTGSSDESMPILPIQPTPKRLPLTPSGELIMSTASSDESMPIQPTPEILPLTPSGVLIMPTASSDESVTPEILQGTFSMASTSVEVESSNESVPLPSNSGKLLSSGSEVVFEMNVAISNEADAYDLPVRLSENGLLSLVNGSDDQPQPVSECNDEMALKVIESAITDEMKENYNAAYLNGHDMNDSMYTTWKMYKEKITKEPQLMSNEKFSSPLLTFPTQVMEKKVNNNKKSHYFVITSEQAYKEKLNAKLAKEKKQADAEERKKQRQLKKELKETMKTKQPKVKKEKKNNVK